MSTKQYAYTDKNRAAVAQSFVDRLDQYDLRYYAVAYLIEMYEEDREQFHEDAKIAEEDPNCTLDILVE
jgi:hypothetical protein